jgi:hypothetical protein
VTPQEGDLIQLDERAGAQFTAPATFRVLAVRDATLPGWYHLHGYYLTPDSITAPCDELAHQSGITILDR